MNLKITCGIGLLLFVISNWLFTLGPEIIYTQSPVDFAHWMNLIGVVLLLRFTKMAPGNVLGSIGSGLTYIGVIGYIGLNTIDFISWSFGLDYQARAQFYDHLGQYPAIVFPFIIVGPSLLFLGLSFYALNYIKTNFMPYLLISGGAIFAGLSHFIWDNRVLVATGFTVFALGMVLHLLKMERSQQSNTVSNNDL